MSQWLLPTLSEILQDMLPPDSQGGFPEPFLEERDPREEGRSPGERLWMGAIAALGQWMPAPTPDPPEDAVAGMVLCGPLPMFQEGEGLGALATWVFIPDLLLGWLSPPLQLLPAGETGEGGGDRPAKSWDLGPGLLPLLPKDPLNTEQFCLVVTRHWGLVLVLGSEAHPRSGFQFSFDPAIVQRCGEVLQARANLTHPDRAATIAQGFQAFPPCVPDYRQVSQFCHGWAAHLVNSSIAPTPAKVAEAPGFHHDGSIAPLPPPESGDLHLGDLHLLQALAHEVRTPLATIRTLTRLLLRRQDLAPEVLKRLDVIDHECTEQIDRFNLIFRAAEMETQSQPRPRHLAATALDQVFQTNVPRWQKQASRRNLTLAVSLPPQMPLVVSDPTMLEQALTGLIERFTRHLPAGSHIEVEVSLAGPQLKVQLQAVDPLPPPPSLGTTPWDREFAAPLSNPNPPQFQALGQLLMFQPDTGSVSLNLEVTKNLFHALGGKLKVRETSSQGEVLTVFLPLEVPPS